MLFVELILKNDSTIQLFKKKKKSGGRKKDKGKNEFTGVVSY